MMKQTSLLLLLLLSAGCRPALRHPYRPAPIAHGEDCAERAGRELRKWRTMGWDQARIERTFQQELAACLGADPASAGLLTAANFDYARLGRQLLSGNLAPDAYLAAVRDRSRKLRNARTIPNWLSGFKTGDRDSDLVPDDRDKCPHSPDLSPTDDYGCPQNGPLPPAPSPEDIKRVMQTLKVAISPACKDAPPPSQSTPLQIGLDRNDEDTFYIAVSKTSDQPAACPVFYDIRIRSEHSSFFSQSSRSSYFYFVFRASENVDTSAAARFRHVFPVRRANVSRWHHLAESTVEPSDREDRIVEVRTVNGNGLSRGWSEPRTFSMTPGTRHFSPF